MSHTSTALKKWRREVFGEPEHHIRQLQQQLAHLHQSPAPNFSDIHQIEQEITRWYDIKARNAFQNAREHTLPFQDKNVIYFHARANFRRRRNQIDTIQDSQALSLHVLLLKTMTCLQLFLRQMKFEILFFK